MHSRPGDGPGPGQAPAILAYAPHRGATRRAQSGFNLVELMLVVGIIGVLASFGIQSYQGATIKAHIAEALALVSPLRLAVAESIASDKQSNACSAVTDILVRIGSVERSQCTDDGTQASLRVEMAPEAGNLVVTMVNSRNSPTLWVCVPDPAFANYPYLPSSCRN